jgi:acyl-CoA synthetase (AMP-forming)/AMP-acid ligase II
MPLFHIHGLVATVLSTLGAGGTVFCTSGFNALKFFCWMDEAESTWYSAVPTMHQAIVARAKRHKEIIHRAPLRFIRSSSSPLPPKVMQALEDTFAVPVIEAYAMTEAAYQITSNPLPPLPRKPGSVGLAAGPAVAIMDQAGTFLQSGSVGEVVIRGPNVTPGYEHNPQANAENFTNGWFRTGDQGVLDADDYLTITGRLKEIINQGGEKISPREVDSVIMDHPAVHQVATFPMPHPKLGEQVAAAIVLRKGSGATDTEIRDYAARRLAHFKIPRQIFFVEEIPKSPLGKLRRLDLAKRLGAT